MEIKGVIKKIGEIQVFSNFEKRDFVLETDEQYPQTLALELHGSKVDIIDTFNVGDRATVGINLKGREWVSPQGETKYFNTIVAWKILKP